MITRTSNPFEAKNGIDATIQSAYLECINAMTPETDVRIALYMWSKWNGSLPKDLTSKPGDIYNLLIQKLRNCKNTTRDLILDIDYSNEDNLPPFVDKLKAAGAQVFYPKYKNPGEKGKANGKMHNKTFTFNKLTFPEKSEMLTDVLLEFAGKTIYNVVIQSSANIWPNQYAQANQMVLYYQEIDNSDTNPLYLYTILQLNSIIETVQKTELEPLKFPVVNPEQAYINGNQIIDFAMPRSNDILPHEGSYPNIYESILEEIIKSNEDFKRYPSGFIPKIRIAMGLFSKKDIAHRLVKLSNIGVSVKVISRGSYATEIGMGSGVQTILEKSNSKVELALLCRDESTDIYPCQVHSKFMLYEVFYDNFRTEKALNLSKITWAGSLNFEYNGLTKDAETLLQMEDDTQYQYMKESWDNLWLYKDLECKNTPS